MLNVEGRHPDLLTFADMFEFDHLPAGLPREVSATFHQHAQQLADMLPDNLLLLRALHRLWEAKNEAVFLAVRVAKARTS